MNSPGLLVGALLCAAIGIGLGCFAVSLRRKTTAFVARAARVPATVVELVRVGDSDGDTFAPRYVFRDGAGRERNVLSKSSSRPAKYSVGQQVTVFFEAETGESRLDNWLDLHGAEVILAILATAALLAAGVCVALWFS